jgi:hypothetical protein
MKIFFNATFTDLGPFRAIKYDKLLALNMEENLWMDCRNAACLKKKMYVEIPVRYKIESGFKVSGTKGSVMAGIK